MSNPPMKEQIQQAICLKTNCESMTIVIDNHLFQDKIVDHDGSHKRPYSDLDLVRYNKYEIIQHEDKLLEAVDSIDFSDFKDADIKLIWRMLPTAIPDNIEGCAETFPLIKCKFYLGAL